VSHHDHGIDEMRERAFVEYFAAMVTMHKKVDSCSLAVREEGKGFVEGRVEEEHFVVALEEVDFCSVRQYHLY
jgi:hypothetical protein